MIGLYIALAIAALCLIIIIFILSVSYWAYRKAFYSNRKYDIYDIPKGEQYQKVKDKMLGLIAEMDALPYEKVVITSRDGLKLCGRYYHVADNAPLQIQFHGYRGSAVRDFCGGNKLARKNGFNTLLIDERAHGESGGKTITFGIKERYDCLAWIEYAEKRFGDKVPIYLAGVSMGAATVLMASEFDLPANVRGIIADCPYSSPPEIIKKVCSQKISPAIVYPSIKLGAKLFGKFNLEEASATEAVKKAKVPILLLHGEDDRFVPCDMSKKIAESNDKITLVTFPGAGHGISYIIDPERYENAIREFVAATVN